MKGGSKGGKKTEVGGIIRIVFRKCEEKKKKERKERTQGLQAI